MEGADGGARPAPHSADGEPDRARRRGRAWLAAVAVAFIAGGAAAQQGDAGYLAPDAFDILAVLPPAPEPGDARARADRAIFRSTRRLAGTPRWDLATSDVRLAPADLASDFSCALGVALTPADAPRTTALIARAATDTLRGTGTAKTHYKRPRPFQIDRGRICQPASELSGSFDYPSGHTTLGWTWATLLAELAPDRASAILARGRAYGESRIVCGVHNASAVEAGRLSAAATLAAVHGSPDFQRDLAAARTELAALRSGGAGPDQGRCTRETMLIAEPVLQRRNSPRAQ